jgi:hypothetical protein
MPSHHVQHETDRRLGRIRTRSPSSAASSKPARTTANSNSDDARSPTAMNFISDPDQLEQLDLTILDE